MFCSERAAEAINPDAHETEGLQHVAAGINSARKGCLTKENILNTRDLAGVKRCLLAERK